MSTRTDRLSFVSPLMPTMVPKPPEDSAWIHEVKHDGFRTQLVVDRGKARAYSRNGHDWTDRYPGLVEAAAKLPCKSAILDGEAVIQDDRGASDFYALGKAIARKSRAVCFIAFDLLHLDGKDLRPLPLIDRRAKLAELLAGATGPLGFSEAFEGSGATLFAACDRMNLEGIISKRVNSRYTSGDSRAWLKIKCWTTSDLILIGLEKDRSGIPMALLAKEDGGRLSYAGSAIINTGAAGIRIRGADQALTPPVKGMKRKGATWLEPRMRLRIRHLKGEHKGLRHATVDGILDG